MKKSQKRATKKKNKAAFRSLYFAAGIALFAAALFFHVSKNKLKEIIISPTLASSFSDTVTSLAIANPGGVTLHLTAGSYTVDTDFTIPDKINLRFDVGAVIAVPNGATLTIQGPIDDTTSQIFDDQNSDPITKGVRFTQNFSFVRPEWWGAKADNDVASADKNSDAINRAMYAMKSEVLFSIGKYYISQTIKQPAEIFLVGQGDVKNIDNSSVIQLKDSANVTMLKEAEAVRRNNYVVRNIRFDGGNQSQSIDGAHFTNSHWVKIENCGFTNFTGWAIGIGGATAQDSTGQIMIDGNWIDDSVGGMRLNIFDSWVRNNEVSATGAKVVDLEGFSNPFSGNMLDGKSSATDCLFLGAAGKELITNNTMRHCAHGFRFTNGGPGQFTDNLLESNQDGIYTDGFAHWDLGEITDNEVVNNSHYGMNFNVSYGYACQVLIRDNTLTGNVAGPISLSTQSVFGDKDFEAWGHAPLVEDNEGIDANVGDNYPILQKTRNPNPVTYTSRIWRTANAAATTISNFVTAPPGKDVIIFLGDNNTTIKFSGTTNLRGNAGVDWHPSSGDKLRCKRDDSVPPAVEAWYCECYDNTP